MKILLRLLHFNEHRIEDIAVNEHLIEVIAVNEHHVTIARNIYHFLINESVFSTHFCFPASLINDSVY